MAGRKVISLEGGFTMIELLMVIIIVAVLGATAMPQFLDFRKEGRLAAMQQTLQAIRTGISFQKKNVILRCGAPVGTNFDYETLRLNSVVTNGPCSTTQIPNPSERRFVDQEAFPTNPYNGFNSVYHCNANCNDHCAAVASGECEDGTNVGWCMDQDTYEIWPNSNVEGECAL